MNRPLVYLDLDRTLFDTRKVGLIWQELARHYDIDAKACANERSKFYVWDGPASYCHDFSKQLRSYGLPVEEAYEKLENSELANGQMEFPYVNQLINTLSEKVNFRILTYGTDDYQRFKAALCPSLKGVEVVTTLQQKGDFLRETAETCWLVDDKPIGKELPERVKFVQVALEMEVPDFTAPWPIFTSLKDVKEYLYEELH